MRSIARFTPGGAHRSRLKALRQLADATAASPAPFTYDRFHSTGTGSAGFYVVNAKDGHPSREVFLTKGQAEVFAAGWLAALISGGESSRKLRELYRVLLPPIEPALEQQQMLAASKATAAPLRLCTLPPGAVAGVWIDENDMVFHGKGIVLLSKGQPDVFACGWIAALLGAGESSRALLPMFITLRAAIGAQPLEDPAGN